MASRPTISSPFRVDTPLIIEDVQNIVEPLPDPADLPVAHLPRRTRNKTNQTTVLMNPVRPIQIPETAAPRSPFEWLTRGVSALTNAFIVPPSITR